MTLVQKIKWWFLEQVNWCHPTDRDGNEKPKTLFYTAYCFLFWPIPWQDTPCWCCASVRGIMLGLIFGFLAGYLFYGL